jgi:hypothetical protein
VKTATTQPAAVTETTTTTDLAPTFEIVHRGILLADTRRSGKINADPNGYVYKGDVARVRGQLIAQWLHTGNYGATTWYRPWSESDDPLTVTVTPPIDWARRVRQTLHGAQGDWNELGPATDDDEGARLQAMFPAVAAKMRIGPRAHPKRLFDPGRTFFPRVSPSAWFETSVWHRHLADHVAGNWGSHGAFEEVTLSPEVVWTEHTQCEGRKNDIAIARGVGRVLSQFVLPEEAQRGFKRPEWFPNRKFHVECLTALSRDGNRTLLSIGSTD